METILKFKDTMIFDLWIFRIKQLACIIPVACV